MNTIRKEDGRHRLKKLRFWLIFVATPIIVVVCSSLAVYALYVKNQFPGKQGIEKGLIYANLNRHTEAIEEFKKELTKNPENAKIYYHIGVSYFKLKEYEKAKSEFRIALKIDPDYSDAHVQLAVINLTDALEMRKLGKKETLVLEKLLEAEEICRDIIKRNPNSAGAYTYLGDIHFAQGFIDDAIADYKKALQLDDSLTDTHIALARLYMKEGNLDLAEKECNMVLSQVDPHNYQVKMLMPAIYAQQGKYDKGITFLRQILEHKPDDIMATAQLSSFYLITSRYDEALSTAEKAFKLSPSGALPPIVYFVKGCVLLQRKDYADAAVMLKEAAVKMPRLMQAHYYLALALAESGRVEEAKTEFQSAINIDSGFIPAQLGLARLQARDGRYKETVEVCKNILHTEPENVDAMQIMGMAYIRMRDFEAAGEKFKEVLNLKPSTGDINMAYLSLESGQLSKCIRQCEDIIKINPGAAKVYDILGLAHVRRGEFDKGIERFVKAIELEQDSANTRINLAKAYMIAGKNKEAIKTLEDLISLKPLNLSARMFLANLYEKEGNVDVAVKTIEKVLEIDPNYVPGYALASLYLLQGRTDESIGIFDRALQLEPENVILNIDFAVAYQQKGNHKASILYGQKAVKLKPEIPSFNIVMTNLYAANGEFVKAREQVKSISMLNDDEKKEYLELIDSCREDNEKGRQVALGLNRAIVARQKGIFDLAISECEKAAKIFPDNVIPEVILASTYLSSNQEEEAIKVFNEIIDRKPEFESSYRGLGKAYVLAHKQDEAISIYKDLVDMDNKSVAARLTLARLLLKKGSTDEAVKMINEATELDPENLVARNLSGKINLASAKYGEAEKEFLKIFESRSDTFEGHFNMARTKFAQGDYDKCIEHCSQGLEIKPTDVRLHNILGAAYVRKGMMSNAVTAFNKIIDINSDYVPAYLNLAKINLMVKQPATAEFIYKMALKIRPDTLEALMGLGHSYAVMGNHQAAIGAFEDIIREYPDNVNAHLSMARSYMALDKLGKLDKSDKAGEVVMKVLEKEPKNLPARFLLSKIYVRGEDIQKAINQLKPVLSENPKLKNAYGLGILYMDNGEYDNAIATYKQGVENFPENALLWCNMAVVLLMKEDNAGAKDACRKALDIQPDGVILNLCMTNILMISGEYKNAKRNLLDMKKLRIVQKGRYLSLIESCSRDEELARKVGRHLSRAIAYVNNKWYKRASVEYGEIMKLVPSNTLAYYEQADIMRLTGEYDMAIEACKKIIELEPESSAAYVKLAAIHNRKGEKDEAIAQYRKAISIDPENAAAYLNLGMLLESKDVLNESIDAYKKVIELNPTSPVAYNNLAWLYATKVQDKLEDALRLAEKAKELAPNSAAIIDTLGMIYYQNGMNDEALPELETAVKGAPWNPTIRYHLGMVYYKKGQQSSALSQMERALKISSTFPEAEEAMGIIKEITMIKEDAKKPVTVIQ